ncbi:MAG TPA: DUF4249 family protein [Flavipsychrobacter sp.]
MGLLATVIAFVACTKKLELPDIPHEKKITLIAELVANDSFYVRAGQSVPLTRNSSLYFDLLRNMKLSVEPVGLPAFALTEYAEEFTGQAYTLPFASSQKIAPNTTYQITAAHPEVGTATAKIMIPGPFTASIIDTAHIQYSSADALQADITINDDAASEHYYVIEVLKQIVNIRNYFYHNNQWLDAGIYANKLIYDSLVAAGVQVQKHSDTTFQRAYTRQGVYSNDPNTENVKDGDIFAMNKRILLKDNYLNGQNYTTRVIIRNTVNEFEEDARKGVVHIMVKSVPKEYFEFLKAYEQYDPSVGFNSLAPPVKLTGNVENGLGMVGAAYEVRFSYWFDTWGF